MKNRKIIKWVVDFLIVCSVASPLAMYLFLDEDYLNSSPVLSVIGGLGMLTSIIASVFLVFVGSSILTALVVGLYRLLFEERD
ncbi:hypothetical protein Phi40:1_gp044 [Cellulophaga phage phi40:1]|uniref:Uncharacterized protein n=1 Tax=Cellulophaga phage phi38:1 TaxID=1327977 RepID=R9ZXV1_9CAUD|nr:hypothetical protein Phi38:1_gp044 [Cellulophaga phage phi38:1]AGO47909.1 hypothetical protein Phi40:1_gp044 [Cellulophaga phage phi40:1]AGO48074.1 hypothetical protein Phi38:1_gp044 [Cellulophaga phage phi38:1]|tara:strand:- start:52 stop:300 length:249 start_codon:yes stop_codon:yes gene_type:complete